MTKRSRCKRHVPMKDGDKIVCAMCREEIPCNHPRDQHHQAGMGQFKCGWCNEPIRPKGLAVGVGRKVR
jgi:hypothetical protein